MRKKKTFVNSIKEFDLEWNGNKLVAAAVKLTCFHFQVVVPGSLQRRTVGQL